MNRRLMRWSIRHLVVPTLFGVAGCAGSHSSRDGIARRNTIDAPIASGQAAPGRLSPSRRGTTVSEPSGSRGTITQTSATDAEQGRDDLAMNAAAQDGSSAPPGPDEARVLHEPSSNLDEGDRRGRVTDSNVPAYSLNLSGILQLADARNPNVALARERISEAYSRVERAETLWLPSMRAGLNYNHHEGAIQNVAGDVFQTNRSAFGGGLGAGMFGAASPTVPALSVRSLWASRTGKRSLILWASRSSL